MPNSAPPFQPTTSVLNDQNQPVAWDLLEQSSKEIGLPATAKKYGVKLKALHARKMSHKWRGCPDARSLAKRKEDDNTELQEPPGDFTKRITAHRERVFKLASDSLGIVARRKTPMKLKSPKDVEIMDRVARRAAGIDDNVGANANVLIHINEAIEDHKAPKPIEAREIRASLPPCTTASLPNDQGNSELGQQ